MTTSGSRTTLLLDTSAALAFALADHEQHESAFSALADGDLGLAGHAAFETFSVLTRLPTPGRLSAAAAARLIAMNFPSSRFLEPGRAGQLLPELARHGISGGAVYDALVGAAAREHGLTLISRDRRAEPTYRKLGVELHLLE